VEVKDDRKEITLWKRLPGLLYSFQPFKEVIAVSITYRNQFIPDFDLSFFDVVNLINLQQHKDCTQQRHCKMTMVLFYPLC
jgi:hypothetical protein